jgi:hypothetical protein
VRRTADDGTVEEREIIVQVQFYTSGPREGLRFLEWCSVDANGNRTDLEWSMAAEKLRIAGLLRQCWYQKTSALRLGNMTVSCKWLDPLPRGYNAVTEGILGKRLKSAPWTSKGEPVAVEKQPWDNRPTPAPHEKKWETVVPPSQTPLPPGTMVEIRPPSTGKPLPAWLKTLKIPKYDPNQDNSPEAVYARAIAKGFTETMARGLADAVREQQGGVVPPEQPPANS